MLRALFLNLSVFVTMTYLLTVTYRSWPPGHSGPWLWARWVLLAAASASLMLFPAELTPGVNLDLRAMPVVFAALRYGAGPGLLIALPGLLLQRLTGEPPAAALGVLGVILGASLLRPHIDFANPNTAVWRRWIAALPALLPYGLWLALLPDGAQQLRQGYWPTLLLNMLGMLIGGSMLAARLRSLQLAERFRTQALLDPLTRLANRRQFDHDLVYLTPRDALVMVDIDLFKSINDTYGHAAGDDALRRVAQALAATLRPHDTAYRYGGEEFVLILRDLQPGALGPVADRVRQAAAGLEWSLPDLVGGAPARVTLTVSVGAAHASERPDTTVARADAALYSAKRQGRNRTVVHPATTDAALEAPPRLDSA